MNRLGIKYQILLITFIPAFLIDVFFTYLHITTSIEQAQELLQSKGRIISKQIASASEFNLFSGNDQQIQYTLDQVIDTNEIIFAAVFNFNGELVAESVSQRYDANRSTNYYYYHNAILLQSIAVSDVFAPDQIEGLQDNTIGWVHLYISRQQLENTTAQVIRDSIVFFIIVLIMTISLTIIISRGITNPIFKLMEHLKRVETGHLGEVIDPVESNEIGAVQLGFNRMTQSLLTNRKHLNDRIQQATQQLSEAITDLEAKNRELGFARDEAQNANRIKSEFLANMSHEIRTPINGIKGFISLLSQTALAPQQQRYAEIILKSTNDLTSIINEILDFSKLESGKLRIVENDFDLYEVIESTRDILFIGATSKNIDLILIIYSDTPRYVSGDKLRLKQILLNLIGNAIKFTDKGQVVIRVSLHEASNNEAEIQIVVEDTGIGISDQDQEELFTAFNQVESALNRRYTGTGLGLAISKNLVTLMGGDVTMKSHYGEGSSFTIRLPFSIPYKPESSQSDKAEPLSALIFSSTTTCLQEIQSLYDRAGTTTEIVLIEGNFSPDNIIEMIQHNLKFIDLVVFDLRHFDIDPNKLLNPAFFPGLRVVLMHYDQSLMPMIDYQDYEFISIIITSTQLEGALISQPETHKRVNPITPVSGEQNRKLILLVDDNKINLKLGGELVRLWGHEAIEATHAREAMEFYRKHQFDLIILDIQMPDIDGTTLLKMMREEKPADNTSVVALTANILHNEADRLINFGFDYYLSKPIDEEKFKAILDGTAAQIDRPKYEIVDGNKPESLKSVDVERSLALSANNKSLLVQIFEILQREIPVYQRQLDDAIKQSDRGKISMIAHKIHGATCYASLPKLRRQVLTIQQEMAKNLEVSLDNEIEEIIEELENIKTFVQDFTREHSKIAQ